MSATKIPLGAPGEAKDGEAAEDSEMPTPLEEEVKEARADLTRLHRDVVDAEDRLVSSHAAQLLEANERLVVSTVRAQTHAEASAAELRGASRASQRDVLTSLPNRTLLLDRLAHAIASAKRRSTRLALLFLDLNEFKQINDTLGHAVGDEALRTVAQCLTSSVRDADTVSRHGGDEFLILLSEVSQAADAFRVAQKIITALGAPHALGDQLIRLSASIGISIYPDDGEEASMLIDRADAAMYLAKKREAGSVVFHGLAPRSEFGAVAPTAPEAQPVATPAAPEDSEPRKAIE
jgi:diguanylate cyclase (GGDEF)-like protein